MEPIKVNKDAKATIVQEKASFIIAKILSNARNGVDTTEIYIDLDNHPRDVMEEVRATLDKSGTNYHDCIVQTVQREFPARGVRNCTSMTIGDQKYYKIKVY